MAAEEAQEQVEVTMEATVQLQNSQDDGSEVSGYTVDPEAPCEVVDMVSHMYVARSHAERLIDRCLSLLTVSSHLFL